MTDFIIHVLVYIKHLPWQEILIYLGSAGVIIPVTQWLKNKLNNKTKQKVFAIITGISAVPPVVDKLAQDSSWTQYLPSQFGWLFAAVVLLHAFFASPVWRRALATAQQYKQALQIVREEGNVQNAPIDNPSLTLNIASPTVLSQQSEPEKPIWTIQG